MTMASPVDRRGRPFLCLWTVADLVAVRPWTRNAPQTAREARSWRKKGRLERPVSHFPIVQKGFFILIRTTAFVFAVSDLDPKTVTTVLPVERDDFVHLTGFEAYAGNQGAPAFVPHQFAHCSPAFLNLSARKTCIFFDNEPRFYMQSAFRCKHSATKLPECIHRLFVLMVRNSIRRFRRHVSRTIKKGLETFASNPVAIWWIVGDSNPGPWD